MSRYSQRTPGKPKLQASHPAFIRAAARLRSLGVNPKYLNASARRVAEHTSKEWEVLAEAWEGLYARDVIFGS